MKTRAKKRVDPIAAMALAMLQAKERAESGAKVWPQCARPDQLWPEGNWKLWFAFGGRGAGKTLTGAGNFNDAITHRGVRNGMIVGAAAGDVRTTMIDGPSGLIATAYPGNIPTFHPSDGVVRWPNGAVAVVRSAEAPERIRGVNSELTWADEVASWDHEAWVQVELSTRIGEGRKIVTTTPRPKKWLKALMKRPSTVVTMMSTEDNRDNLSEEWYETVRGIYAGTILERQELLGEFVDDETMNLWPEELLERMSITKMPCEVVSSAVGLDPQAKFKKGSNLTGIIGVSLGTDMNKYIRADWSGAMSPTSWAKASVDLVRKMQRITNAPCSLAYEDNQGGDMILEMLKPNAKGIRISSVTAVKSKGDRALPVSMSSDQGKVFLVGDLKDLKEQMSKMMIDSYDGVGSPDRVDAMVHACRSLGIVDPRMLISGIPRDGGRSAA